MEDTEINKDPLSPLVEQDSPTPDQGSGTPSEQIYDLNEIVENNKNLKESNEELKAKVDMLINQVTELIKKPTQTKIIIPNNKPVQSVEEKLKDWNEELLHIGKYEKSINKINYRL